VPRATGRGAVLPDVAELVAREAALLGVRGDEGGGVA